MVHVFFEPWVGQNYQTGGIFRKKILVLGESHYCGNPECKGKCGFRDFPDGGCEDFTQNTVKDYLNGKKDYWTSTYLKFEKSLYDHSKDNDYVERDERIWNSLAFFNFLQVDMIEARKGGTSEDYEEGRIAFLEVIEELQPDLIIAWGTTRLWNNLPGKEAGWIEGEELIVDNWSVPNGYYQLTNGKQTRIIAVYHPSSGYSWDWWYKVISTQL